MIKSGDIIIKDINVLQGLMERNFHPLLIQIILEIATKYGIVITESYREKRHINDLHGTNPVRALDIRTYCYDKNTVAKIEKYINTKWIYDGERKEKKCCVVHDSGQGRHAHIQVNYRTKIVSLRD